MLLWRDDMVTEKIESDDFDWTGYHEIYGKQLGEIAKIHIQKLTAGDYVFKEGELVMNRETLSLHPNHRLLYETIEQLSPASVVECGCGWGDHLHNLNVLLPHVQLSGIDLSMRQIDALRKRHPKLTACVEQFDLSLPMPVYHQTFDIAYTQAVIMHMQIGNSHLVALSNVFKYAEKQVVLMENWSRHDFMADITGLFTRKMISWKNLYFYYRDSKEFQRPYIMIISAVPLSGYPELTDYATLSNAVMGH